MNIKIYEYFKKIWNDWKNNFENITIKYYKCIDNIIEYNFPKDGLIEWNTQTTMYNLHIDIIETIDKKYLENINIDYMVGVYQEALINTLINRNIPFSRNDNKFNNKFNDEIFSKVGRLEIRQFDHYEFESDTLTTEELINKINNIYAKFYPDWGEISTEINWNDYETLMGLIMGSIRFKSYNDLNVNEKVCEHITELIRRLLIGVS